MNFANYLGYPMPPGGDSGNAAGSTFTFLTCANEVANLPNSLQLEPGAGVSFSYGLNTLTINASTASGGLGTVISVGLAAPVSFFNVTGSPVTSSGTLTLTLVSQASNQVFAGPSSGANAAPTFRYLVGADIVGALAAGANITLTPVGSTIQINSTATGGVTSVSSGNITGLATVNVANPTTAPAFTFTLVSQSPNTAYMGPVSGAAATPTFRVIQGQDISSIFVPSSNMSITPTGSSIIFTSSSPSGTVTSVGSTGLPGYINANVGTPTTTPAISLSWVNQTSGTFLAGPSSGVAGGPWFRSIQGLDISPIFIPGTNVSLVETPTSITINSSNSGGTVTSVSQSVPVSIFSTSGSPITGSGTLAISLVAQQSGLVWAGPISGANANPTFRFLTVADLPSSVGTVQSVALSSPASIISTGGSPITTSGTLTQTLIAQPSATAWLGPLSGANSAPTFRAITLTDLPSTVGTVQSVGLNLPVGVYNVTNSPITASGTLTATFIVQGSGQFFAGPVSGANGTPSFRKMNYQDLPIAAGSNIIFANDGTTLTISASVVGGGGGTVTSVSQTVPPTLLSVSGSPITTSGTLNISLISQLTGLVFAGPSGGASGPPVFRLLTGNDLVSAVQAGAGMTVTNLGTALLLSSTSVGGGSGTVTSVALTGPASIINTAGSPITSSGTLTQSLVSQPSATAWLGPLSGANAAPTFRAITTTDLPATVGTVQVVALSVPGALLSISGSPVTTSGTLAISLLTQPSGTVFGGPSSGANATPTFRALTLTDLPATVQTTALNDGQVWIGNGSNLAIGTTLSGDVTVSDTGVTAIGANKVTGAKFRQSVAISVVGNSTNATANVADISATVGSQVLASNVGGTAIGFRALTLTDIPFASGTVTSVAVAMPVSIISVAGSPITSSGTITGTLVAQPSGTVWAGPTSGANATPAFRNLTLADLPSGISGSSSGTVASFAAGNLSTWFNTSVATPSSTPVLTFLPTGAKGDIAYFSNTNTAANLPVGLNSQVIGVVSGLPTYVNTLQGFASAVTSNVLTNASPSYQAMDASAGAVVLTLPAASAAPSDIFYFKNITATGSNSCTVQTNGTDTIEGSFVAKTILKLQIISVISDGVRTWRYLKPQIDSPTTGGTGSSTSPTDGQVLIGSTSAGTYTPANIVGSGGITVTNGPNTITISGSGGGGGGTTQAWSTISTSITAAINTTYEVIVSGGNATAFFPSGAQTADTTIGFKIISIGSPANTFTIQPYTTIDGSSTPFTSNRINEYFLFKYGVTGWWAVS